MVKEKQLEDIFGSIITFKFTIMKANFNFYDDEPEVPEVPEVPEQEPEDGHPETPPKK